MQYHCGHRYENETIASILEKLMSYKQVESPEDVGAIIQQLRKRTGIRQNDMAAIVGRSHVTLRDVEKGKASVAIGTVLQLLDELGVRVYLDVPS